MHVLCGRDSDGFGRSGHFFLSCSRVWSKVTEVQYHDTPQEHTTNTDKVTCDEPAKKLGSEYFFRAQRQDLGSAQQVSMEISFLQESSGMRHPLPGY